MLKPVTIVAMLTLLSGCMTAPQHRQAVQDDSLDKLSVGAVQREIRLGMSGAEVAGVLGSPNVVTTDELRREVWLYDRISTESVYSGSSGGVSALIFGTIDATGIGAAPGYTQGAGARSTSQRTITVIIKFDESDAVRDFAYHSSRF